MNEVVWIISIIGSIISILGVVYTVIKKESKRNIILNIVTFVIIVALAIISRLYINQIDEERKLEYRKEMMMKEARQLMKSLPSSSSYYEQGKNEGLMISLNLFLEKYKDIVPDSYALYQTIIIARINNDKEEFDSSKNRVLMEAAGDQALTILKSIAGE